MLLSGAALLSCLRSCTECDKKGEVSQISDGLNAPVSVLMSIVYFSDNNVNSEIDWAGVKLGIVCGILFDG